VAVGFSLAKEPPSESIMMGFQSLMNMWFWKADLDAQFWGTGRPPSKSSPNIYYNYEARGDFPLVASEVKNSCQELLAVRAGSLSLKEKTSVSARGRWRAGKWQVVFKRALLTEEKEESIQFSPGRIYMTFAVWDGDKGDRGSRKSISDWVILEIGPVRRKASNGVGNNPNNTTSAAGNPEPRVINILARRFEYEPSRIIVQKGELVTLRLESADVTHGLYLDGYGLDIKARPGMIGKATFRADKTGRYAFRCSVTCGEFHPYMIGFLIVEPNSRFHLFLVATLGAGLVIAVLLGWAHFRREKGPTNV
jgi:heme/copper-type cytochrome/quinol oxidase subunit 2